ncbi:hypothetical protein ACHQM5_020274 [Ranunculus cassubicifolius]
MACRGKSSWPELVGTNGGFAATKVERENPLVRAEIVLEGTIVPIEIRAVCGRVRVWVNRRGRVTRVPVQG